MDSWVPCRSTYAFTGYSSSPFFFKGRRIETSKSSVTGILQMVLQRCVLCSNLKITDM